MVPGEPRGALAEAAWRLAGVWGRAGRATGQPGPLPGLACDFGPSSSCSASLGPYFPA